MQTLQDLIAVVNDKLGWVLIVVLVGVAIYLTIRTGVVQLRMLPEMFRVIGESPGENKDGTKSISSFKAFWISAASRVGTGNIAGIALAISIGGPGAIFWMWLMAIFGAATAFVESTLGQLYKVKDKDSYRGGPAYYMSVGLKQPWMGAFFAVIITVTYGLVFNSLQANSIVDATATSLNVDTTQSFWLPVGLGIFLALVTGAVFLGGVQRISAWSSVIVPVMAVAYLFLGVLVVAMNITEVPDMIMLIAHRARRRATTRRPAWRRPAPRPPASFSPPPESAAPAAAARSGWNAWPRCPPRPAARSGAAPCARPAPA